VEKVVLEGKLMRVFGGRSWDLIRLSGSGHVGLEVVLRQFEGHYVRVVVETLEVLEPSRAGRDDLDELVGIPEKVRGRLRAAGFDGVKSLRAADDSELLQIEGVGRATLARIRAEVGR